MLPLGSTLSCSLLVFWNRVIIKSSRASRIYLPPPTQRVVRFCVDMTCYGFWGTVTWYPTVLSTILPKPELLSKQTEMNDGNELPELSRGKFQLKRSLSNSVQTLKKIYASTIPGKWKLDEKQNQRNEASFLLEAETEKWVHHVL